MRTGSPELGVIVIVKLRLLLPTAARSLLVPFLISTAPSRLSIESSEMSVLNLSVTENAVLPSWDDGRFSIRPLESPATVHDHRVDLRGDARPAP